ncbi:hypothetical protein SBP18_05735 [Rhodoferax ferrireducens]|uniref:hypothetical protein n=1 Tax=Rhodoferax ferrireducens TaxID=192843 RepID=UPI00298D8234|nr:hypothetical protein [Rhodoferax ferrireducens]WPC68014.1 hypothetical protein SBP18_05735 [Rhodoferax ferrireducens]
MTASLPKLHWVNPQNSLGIRPAFWRLKKAGRDIFDHGFLEPSLTWIQGVLGPRDYWILCINAYELLRRACEVQLERDTVHTERQPAQGSPHGFPGTNALSPRELADYFPRLQWPSAIGFSTGTEGFRPVLNLKIAPADSSGLGWNSWCQKWQPAAVRHSPFFQESLSDPYWLIQSSYLWICGIVRNGEQDSDEFSAALTALGLGALGAFPRIECDLCFRLAISQRLRCRHHSDSLLVRGDGDTKNIQNSAEARRACKRLHWPGKRPDFRLRVWPGNEEEVLCGLLWPLTGKQLREESKSLTSVLTQCPNVLLKLPKDILELDANHILSQLRQHLDDCEWNLAAWPGKLFIAEEWLAALKTVAPGSRPEVSEKNVERFQQAMAMLAQSMRKKEIAKALGITPSNLSKILHSGRTKLP